MNIKKDFTLDAVSLQYILLVGCLLVVGGIAATFVLLSNTIKEKAVETDHAKTDSEVVVQEIDRLKKLRLSLYEDRQRIAKADSLLINEKDYQAKVIQDLSRFAEAAKLKVTGFNFDTRKNTTAAGDARKKTVVAITLEQDVPYESFYAFLRAIELNASKMQVISLSIQPTAPYPRVQITNFEIEVYLQ